MLESNLWKPPTSLKVMVLLYVFECYKIISALSISIVMENYLNVQDVVRNIAKNTELATIEMDEIRIKPALDYYKEHLQADIMSTPLKAFKAARLCDPHYRSRVTLQ